MSDADLQRFHFEQALHADRERRELTRGRDIGDRGETGARALAEWTPQVDALVTVQAERCALRQVLASIAGHWNAASSARQRDHLIVLADRLVDVDQPGPRMIVDCDMARVVDAM